MLKPSSAAKQLGGNSMLLSNIFVLRFKPFVDGGKNKVLMLMVGCAILSLHLLWSEHSYLRNIQQFYVSTYTDGDHGDRGGFGTKSSYFWKPIIENDGMEISEFLSVDHTFSGAKDWDNYWTYATRMGKDTVDDDRAHVHDEYVTSAAESASRTTLQHIDEMKSRYESVNALADFYARGLGWVYDRLGMVLTVVITGNHADNSTVEGITLHAGPSSIFIVDTIGKMKCGGGDENWKENQPPLTMWVRANGPEIFAGTALPHMLKPSSSRDKQHRCTWRYDFEPKSAGIYSIHVKLLTFNGFADTPSDDCKTEKITPRNDQFDGQKHNKSIEGDLEKLEAINAEVVRELTEQGNFSHHRGVSGFKMYDEIDACCEACTRSRNCKMWSIPGGRHYDQCELYFDRLEDDVDFLDRSNGRFLGRDRNYSYTKQDPMDFPKVRRSLSFQGETNYRRKLAISPDELDKPWPIRVSPSKGFPRTGEVTPYFLGCGWSSLLSFESPCHYPSDDLVFGSGNKVSILPGTSAVKDLRPCLLDDEKLDISNGRWVQYPYLSDSICSELVRDEDIVGFRDFRPVYRGDRSPSCWYRDDLTKIGISCMETGCGHIHKWMTDLKKQSKWFGRWEPYECNYYIMGDAEIQQCIDQKKISKIEYKGLSIKAIVQGYMSQKLQHINMTKNEGSGSRSVFIDTLSMPHLLWHKSIDKHQKDLEDTYPNVTDSEDEHYWISGFYYTSEREPHVQVDRSLQFSKLAWDILTPKGYKMINGFDVTTAFSFDTAGQADGIHMLGPPIKEIVTKVFHHLCNEVL